MLLDLIMLVNHNLYAKHSGDMVLSKTLLRYLHSNITQR